MITRENYEIYIIDYLDENLSSEDQKALMRFLDRNLDLKEEFELMKDFQMPESNEIFEQKESLKKNITEQKIDESNIDEWCIAAVEKDLDDVDMQKFKSVLQGREEFQQVYALYKQLKLKGENIQYPEFKPWRLPDFNLAPLAEDVDFWVIADLEGDLTLKQKQSWIAFKSQIINIEDIEKSYRNIKLQPEAIIYPDKEKLKHKKSRIRYLYTVGGIAAAAAAFYLFLNVANFKQDTFKNFNKQVAKMEQPQDQNKYIPKSLLIHPNMLDQMAIKIQHFEAEVAKQNKKPAVVSSKATQVQTYAASVSIEPIKKREASISASNTSEIDTDMEVEVITADNLMGNYIAKNNQPKYNVQRNKLTLFKVAQKSVSALNKKIGTDMKLEAQYNKEGDKKKVKFSNRLFTVTKTINK